MKKFWKWFLGIVLVLVVLTALVCTAFLMHGGFRGEVERGALQAEGRYAQFQGGSMMGGEYGFDGRAPMMGNGYGNGRRMMGGIGFFPLMGGFMLLRGLVPLALLGLLVYGAFRLGKRNVQQHAQAEVVSQAVVEPVEVAAPEALASHACRKCGGVVQEDWRNCPYCGTKQ
jgi:hypothetical protein